MNKALAHLPKQKQDELELIKDIILEKIPDVRMIVLFGSYARGEWVEDIHTEGHMPDKVLPVRLGINIVKPVREAVIKMKITPTQRSTK
jgi:hypothetical protein